MNLDIQDIMKKSQPNQVTAQVVMLNNPIKFSDLSKDMSPISQGLIYGWWILTDQITMDLTSIPLALGIKGNLECVPIPDEECIRIIEDPRQIENENAIIGQEMLKNGISNITQLFKGIEGE